MKTLFYYFFTGLLLATFVTCKGSKKRKSSPLMFEKEACYVSADYLQRSKGYDWVGVRVKSIDTNTIQISVRSRGDLKRPTCSYDALAYRVNDTMYVCKKDPRANLNLTFKNDSLELSAMPDDTGVFNFYCSGGVSFLGKYAKLDGELDSLQVDKTKYTSVLSLLGASFKISSQLKNTASELCIEPMGDSIEGGPFCYTYNGEIIDAEIGDLDSDGYPEVLVYVVSGKNKVGEVIGFSPNLNKSMSMIYLHPTQSNADNKLLQGYIGHDRFAIVENALVQDFPVFENGTATGARKQVKYKLIHGEAGKVFVADKVIP